MRTDVIIDRRQVQLPYTPTGYEKPKAKFGDWITWKDYHTGQVFNGRVIGRIARVPMSSDPNMKGWLVVACFSLYLTSVSERWVNPSEVINCVDPQQSGYNLQGLWAFLTGDTWHHFSDARLREWVYSGRATP